MTRGQLDAPDTATQILDVTERVVQVRGFNGFSYADVATELKITKAALHYHFAGKAALGQALIERYASRFAESLSAVEVRIPTAPARLDAYAGLYLDVLRQQRMCLCGMMAAEYETLPSPMQDAVAQFFDNNETWLTRVLDEGREAGTLEFTGSSREVAGMIVSSLEGAMLMARSVGDVRRFQTAVTHLLAGLTPASTRTGRVPRRPKSVSKRHVAGLG